jgi:hypothetical protein
MGRKHCRLRIQELAKQKIRSCKTLNKRARNEDSWNELCAAVSGGLREELRDWFQQMYPNRKILYATNLDPQFHFC